jgi:hypothetical protein
MRTFTQEVSQLRSSTLNARRPGVADQQAHPLKHLQHTIGNQAVQRLLQAHASGFDRSSGASTAGPFAHQSLHASNLDTLSAGPQTKLMVNAPGDVYEQESDRVSEQVTRIPEAGLSAAQAIVHNVLRQPETALDQTAFRVGAGDERLVDDPPNVHEALRSPGQPLDSATLAFFEPRLQHDFHNVVVHTGPSAEAAATAMSALAFTAGRDIVFGSGQFAPGTHGGRRLLAHELTHVVQQSAHAPGTNTMNPSSVPVLQRAPGDKERVAEQRGVPDSPYPEEEEVFRYAIGARDLGKLADGVVLYTSKYWKATGISDSAFVAGPFTSDMGNIFYVYRIESADEKKGTHAISRGAHLGWSGDATPELRKEFAKVTGGKIIVVTSTGLIPPTGGAAPQPEEKKGAPGKGAPTPAQDPTTSAPEASANELTPHRKKWMTAGRAGMKSQIISLFNSIQKLKAKRIDVWEKNAHIKDPKPIKDALEVAVTVVGYGMGGVVGGILTKSLAHGLLAEFIKESSLKSTALLAEFIFKQAVEPAEEMMNEAMKKALTKDKETNAKSALASKGDLLDSYVEAVSLQTISEEKAEDEEFNSNADARFSSDVVLADEVAVFDALFDKLRSEPERFLQELSVGLLRLKDEMYLEEKAKKYGGSVERLLKEDPHIHETDYRSGNVLLLPPGQRSLGNYYDTPDVGFDSFHGFATEVNTAALMQLAGAKVKDLPITLTFRFWAFNPFRGLVERVLGVPGDLCKVWFERRPDGIVWVDFDEPTVGDSVSDGIEWLASSYMHSIRVPAGHDLSSEERLKYAPLGALRIYNIIKDKPVDSVSNADIF